MLFLVPMSWWADRGCAIAGVDPLYHGIVWIHQRLGWFVIVLACVSVAIVGGKIVIARKRLARLLDLAEPLPVRLRAAFEAAASELKMRAPQVAYLNVGDRIAATVFGPVILMSRGIANELNDDELLLVARHELVHAKRRDAGAGVFWHLAFAALLLPGFEPLERRLHAAREYRANLTSADGREAAYLAVLGRFARDASLCRGGAIGLEPPVRRPVDRWLMWMTPALIVALAFALPISHREFMSDLPFLLAHHC